MELNLSFGGSRIFVIGDIMLDEYVEAAVNRISPEAPVPVALVRRRRNVPGGAANVARNLASLGCEVLLAGVAGEDGAGETLKRLVSGLGITPVFGSATDRPTTVKTRITAHGQQLLRLDEEDRSPFPDSLYESLWQNIAPRLGGVGAVILSDYDKGVFMRDRHGQSLALRIISRCRELGVPVLVDPKGRDWERYARADVITPNIRELAEATGRAADDYPGLCAGGADLLQRHSFGRILLTRSEKGMTILQKRTAPREIRANAREVADVSGAGDTVIAVAGACMAGGMPFEEAAKMANLAAGIVVGKAGTSTVELGELRNAWLAENMRGAGQLARLNLKICDSLPALQSLVALWRQQGLKVVFTNGCFDLLHAGHIQLVEEAAAQGDKLIVAVNSDSSVKRLKGPERPMQPENARSLVLAALEEVDAVIIFEEDTPKNLIEAITPDVLVKGGDYDPESIVGAEHVRRTGGRVHIAKFRDGFSTTGLIDRARKQD